MKDRLSRRTNKQGASCFFFLIENSFIFFTIKCDNFAPYNSSYTFCTSARVTSGGIVQKWLVIILLPTQLVQKLMLIPYDISGDKVSAFFDAWSQWFWRDNLFSLFSVLIFNWYSHLWDVTKAPSKRSCVSSHKKSWRRFIATYTVRLSSHSSLSVLSPLNVSFWLV